MLGIYIIIMVLILLAAILIISDYIETVEAELYYKQTLINSLDTDIHSQQTLINALVKENTEYRRIADKKNNADRTYWG